MIKTPLSIASIARLLFVAVLLSVFTLPAQADQKLTLIQGALGEDRTFIKQYITKMLRQTTHKYAPSKAWVGRADISRDGIPELFVFIGDTVWCGIQGCDTHVFRKVASKWSYFTELRVTGEPSDSWSQKSLYLRDEGGPYLTMYSYYSGLRWSDELNLYVGFCIFQCPEG